MIRFVGAGPGAPDLITLRGHRLLCEADVIIHTGSLVNPELLACRKAGCAVYDSAGMTLEEVSGVMLEAAARNLSVVRLHTGDPSLYGAVKEQMDVLDRHGVMYDVVPGVSSFLGAAAALRTELTLPGVSQTLILTRMAGRTPVPDSESIEKLAFHKAGMAIFLSAGRLEELVARLISGGYSPDAPAAVVYKATWAEELVVRSTLGELPRAAGGINKTALVFVGDFLGKARERSKLYDPSFSHGYRAG